MYGWNESDFGIVIGLMSIIVKTRTRTYVTDIRINYF